MLWEMGAAEELHRATRRHLGTCGPLLRYISHLDPSTHQLERLTRRIGSMAQRASEKKLRTGRAQRSD